MKLYNVKRSAQLCISVLFMSQAIAGFALASDQAPACLDHGRVLPENNSQVINWKQSTQNEFRARAHVHGVVDRVFVDHSGHNHFEISIGPSPEDTLEVIYSQDFGRLPDITVGMDVEACGDYITSYAPSGPYPASPSGALIHWVHLNPRHHGHDSGYLMIDGTLYGQNPGGYRY